MTQTATRRSATVPCPFCGTLNRVDLARLADRPKCGECGRPILLDRPIKVPGESLDRVVADAEVPVLVDFYADWCAPCKMMAPVLDEVARERAGDLLVGKLDTDRSPAVSERFGIRGIPTLILFRGGKEVARQTGALPKAKLEEWLAAAAA
ncbi:MAG TPA: thioredoxin TrxC [Longimicrobiales bacterium]